MARAAALALASLLLLLLTLTLAPPTSAHEPPPQGGKKPGGHVVCRKCGNEIAHTDDAFPTDGLSFLAKTPLEAPREEDPPMSLFTNRVGISFDVASFLKARARPSGAVHARDSFFPGYTWRTVNCHVCGSHVGWYFERPDQCRNHQHGHGGGGDGQRQPPTNQGTTPTAPVRDSSQAVGGGESASTTLLSRAQNILDNVVSGRCLEKNNGYWIVEWCNARKVTQYHLERSVNPMVRHPEYSLGTFSSQRVVVDGPTLKGAPAVRTYVVQEFTNGQRCDETQAPRTSRVNLVCCAASSTAAGSGIGNVVVGYEEKALCAYELTVCLPELCDLPEFMPPGPQREQSEALSAALAKEVCVAGEDLPAWAPRSFFGLSWSSLVAMQGSEYRWARNLKPVLGVVTS